MARRVKCPECGKLNNKEITVAHNNRYYCKDCFKKQQNQAQDYRDLYDYICELYGIEQLEGMMLKQIKDYKENLGYSYKGMKSTLHYFYEIENSNRERNEDLGLGIIPFIYKKALKFYMDKRDIKRSLKGIDMEDSMEEEILIINKTDIEKADKAVKPNIISIDDI